mmetsp:Transcript_44403/g.84924  ORF Transcript_44403/g.84924 Transcript_44403/m.84924 type:complete len:293 (-) Transcript_44403:2611-3489(-)
MLQDPHRSSKQPKVCTGSSSSLFYTSLSDHRHDCARVVVSHVALVSRRRGHRYRAIYAIVRCHWPASAGDLVRERHHEVDHERQLLRHVAGQLLYLHVHPLNAPFQLARVRHGAARHNHGVPLRLRLELLLFLLLGLLHDAAHAAFAGVGVPAGVGLFVDLVLQLRLLLRELAHDFVHLLLVQHAVVVHVVLPHQVRRALRTQDLQSARVVLQHTLQLAHVDVAVDHHLALQLLGELADVVAVLEQVLEGGEQVHAQVAVKLHVLVRLVRLGLHVRVREDGQEHVDQDHHHQ